MVARSNPTRVRVRNKQPDVVRKGGPHRDQRTRTGRKRKHKGAEHGKVHE